jgi:hypothetical protein
MARSESQDRRPIPGYILLRQIIGTPDAEEASGPTLSRRTRGALDCPTDLCLISIRAARRALEFLGSWVGVGAPVGVGSRIGSGALVSAIRRLENMDGEPGRKGRGGRRPGAGRKPNYEKRLRRASELLARRDPCLAELTADEVRILDSILRKLALDTLGSGPAKSNKIKQTDADPLLTLYSLHWIQT